ncbi:MAG TPA: carbamoyltransferase HypF [Polyangia bacterium]|nr:carbamoyltransferase HypF [Polyangia bacterium]
MSARSRITVDLTGIIQGVGFRPAIAVAAARNGVSGSIRNRAGSVRLVLEAETALAEAFLAGLPAALPRQARIDEVRVVAREPLPEAWVPAPFCILESETGDRPRISIPADLAMCDGCHAEVLDPGSRYFGYPFTTCTGCGPRYTVVDGMPYDRERTALAAFPLCEACKAEYGDPGNRRFHAQSIACPACGPKLRLLDPDGNPVEGDPLAIARAAIAAGRIVAVRGLGGVLLVLDGFDAGALRLLRERKHRPRKPVAVMARSMKVIERWCIVDGIASDTLGGPRAPIVVLDVLEDAASALPLSLLSPGTRTLGVMLPTTPLQLLLAEPLPGDETPPLDLLVMTSGNRGGEPICTGNDEALERLQGIADLFLVHDREIHLRNDDSLVRVMDGKARVWRRARGWAPDAIRLARSLDRTVLALGAELKNAIALGFDDEVVLSPHIGDLETPEAVEGLEVVLDRFLRFFRREPETVAVDLHPDMRCTRIGRRFAASRGLEVVAVQHHHAHALAVMAEHGADEALALIFDGTGLGTDGRIWGAELLHVSRGGWSRLGTFADVPLPGGDAAVAHPVRQLVGRWLDAGTGVSAEWRQRLRIDDRQLEAWTLQCLGGLNTPRSHAAGRVFDAFSVMIGAAGPRVSYEGQAAVQLEAAAERSSAGPGRAVPFDVALRDDRLVIDWAPAFLQFATDPPPARDSAELARGFHEAFCAAGMRMARFGRERTGLARIALGGGVMMNRLVTEGLAHGLRNAGFDVLLARDVPANDGGIALGQVLAACRRKS